MNETKEVTVILTCEITFTAKLSADGVETLELRKEDMVKELKKEMKRDLLADDVVILNNQIFIRD